MTELKRTTQQFRETLAAMNNHEFCIVLAWLGGFGFGALACYWLLTTALRAA